MAKLNLVKSSSNNFQQNLKEKPTLTIGNFSIFRRSLIFQTKEFFETSTLHGVRYIAETGRPIGEKFMWFCFTTIGLVTALIIIMSLWEKFQTNPTITGLDTDFRNTQIDFPSIVICPDNPFDVQIATDFINEKLHNDDQEIFDKSLELLKMLTKLSFDNLQDAYNLYQIINTSLPIGNENLRGLALKMFRPLHEFIETCKFRGEHIECKKNFQSLYTSHGLCYGFNSRFKSNTFNDVNNKDVHTLLETDKQWSLHLVPSNMSRMHIFIFPHDEYFGVEFKPQVYYDIEQEAKILISKKSTFTTEEARQLSIRQRKCIFETEVKLDYFKGMYTFSSCMKECRMKKSIKLCNCIPPFYRPIATKPICNLSQFPCLKKYQTNITNTKDCANCELSCQKNVFDVEKINKNSEKEPILQIAFLTWPIIRYKREVLFGWVDLLVSFGGIAGLFLGFSLLSGVEIIYYFSMRAFCMIYSDRRKLYAIETDVRNQPMAKLDMSLKPRKSINDFQNRTASMEIQMNELRTWKEQGNQKIDNDQDAAPNFLQWYRNKFQRPSFSYLP